MTGAVFDSFTFLAILFTALRFKVRLIHPDASRP